MKTLPCMASTAGTPAAASRGPSAASTPSSSLRGAEPSPALLHDARTTSRRRRPPPLVVAGGGGAAPGALARRQAPQPRPPLPARQPLDQPLPGHDVAVAVVLLQPQVRLADAGAGLDQGAVTHEVENVERPAVQ